MHPLGTVDWLVMAAYLLGIIALGLWTGRGQTTTRDYFLGNRSIPWWGVGLSIVATETSALTFIGVPALAYGDDLSFIQIVLGYVLARILLAVVLVPHYFKGDIYSPYQLFANAFGPNARRVAGVFFLIAGTLAAGVRVYVTCIPIDLMMGDVLSRWFGDAITGAIILFVLLSLAYTYVGGIRAVVWTDAVQFALLMGGGVFALFHIPTLIDGGWPEALRHAGREGKLHWLNPGFSLSLPFNLWMGLIGATVIALSTHGADQLIVQRVLACRSVRDGRRALALSAVIILPMFLVFLLVGTLLWVYYAQVEPVIPLPESRSGFKKLDYIFPIFILTATPPGIKGLLIVAILAAAMSSVSSALSALASVSTMDLIKGGSKRERTDGWYLKLSRGSTVFWALMLVGVALASRGQDTILNWALSLNGLTSGALLGGLILALTWRRGPAAPVITGMIVSLLAMIAISQWHWTETVHDGDAVRKLGWPWFTLTGVAITLAVAWLVRLRVRSAVTF
jgi:SSS family transporter